MWLMLLSDSLLHWLQSSHAETKTSETLIWVLIYYNCHSLSPSALCFPAHIWFSCFSCHHYLISPHLCLDFVPGVSSHFPLQIVCSAPCLLWIIVNVCECVCRSMSSPCFCSLNVSKKFLVSSFRVPGSSVQPLWLNHDNNNIHKRIECSDT